MIWKDRRERLKEDGIKPNTFYVTSLQQNLSGGESPGFAYTGVLNTGWEFDLEKIMQLDSTSFYISTSWATGSNLSATHVGNVFIVSDVFSGQGMRLYELWLDKKIHDNALDIKIGRLSPANDFGLLPVFENYVNTAFNGNIPTLLYNDINFYADPIAQWGSRLLINITDNLLVRTAVYNGYPQDLAKNSKHGLDFAFLPKKGVLAVSEIDYQWNQSHPFAGQLIAGAFYDSSNQPTLANTDILNRGNRQFYFATQQMIFQSNDADPNEGLTAWGTYSYSPSRTVSLFTHFFATGLSYQGLFSRKNDITSIGFAKGWFTQEVNPSTYENVVDLSYVWKVNKVVSIQPDLQYVIRPGGDGILPNAWIFGFMASFYFD